MPKKTARAAKPSQQRSKEEQWRRRVASQTRTGTGTSTGSAVVDPVEAVDSAVVDGDLASEEMTPLASTTTTAAPRSTTTTKSTSTAKSTSAATRRASGTSSYSQRSARSRLAAAATMPVEEEMLYIRADIRKLVLLTGFCVALLLGLAIFLPMILS
jgi:hypothetical protein